ncbi:MAG: EcoRII N-terminal effector-binding domain-containing protein, partial [Litorivicinaceae bacterium]|nr:EcoRII N-terminal effector-binding domain-containing protein [Litorivicinaceae bacterium]
MPSAAFEKAESILMEKGVDLTKSDVKKIESLVDGFSEEEKENDIVMIFGAIESLRADPRSKLFDNGRAAEFTKTLQKNDLGITGGHQSGILIPKSNIELLNFLPRLDNGVKNPDAWIECLDEDDISWKLRY